MTFEQLKERMRAGWDAAPFENIGDESFGGLALPDVGLSDKDVDAAPLEIRFRAFELRGVARGNRHPRPQLTELARDEQAEAA